MEAAERKRRRWLDRQRYLRRVRQSLALQRALAAAEAHPRRRPLPDERCGLLRKFAVAGHEGYLTINLRPETDVLGEIFVTLGKQGGTLRGFVDAFARVVSLALQYGVPAEELINKLAWARFEPFGYTDDPALPRVNSIVDYVVRKMAQHAGIVVQPPRAITHSCELDEFL